MKRILFLLPLLGACLDPMGVRNEFEGSPETRWILIYKGGPYHQHPDYSVVDYTAYLASADSNGLPKAWITTGAIYLELYAPSSGCFTYWITCGSPEATGADWSEYLDTLQVSWHKLDSAVVAVSATLPRKKLYEVSVMIPHPNPKTPDFEYEGKIYNLTTGIGRIDLVRAWILRVEEKFNASGFRNIRLDGFYWLLEGIPDYDEALVKSVAGAIHARGLRFLWIPYFYAEGTANWKELGFDEAWLQPNYYFNPDVERNRFDEVRIKTLEYGINMELELEGPQPGTGYDRFIPYLEMIENHPYLTTSIAFYEGGGAMLGLKRDRPDLFYRLMRDLELPQ